MKAFEVNLQTEPVIVFCDPEKAQQFFIDDNAKDAWRNYFWGCDDLGDLAEKLAKMFYYQKDCLGDPFIEGFGVAKFNTTKKVWEIEDSHFGKIIIEMGDLDHHWDVQDVSKKLNKELARLVK